MQFNPYLFFDGNCREVFEFYRSVFGGEFLRISTFAEAPAEMSFPDSEKERVMHVTLQTGSVCLMGSDTTSLMGKPPVTGDNIAISIAVESRERCDELVLRLSEGGEVKFPLQDTFWGSYFGTCADKYGINWMVSYSPEES